MYFMWYLWFLACLEYFLIWVKDDIFTLGCKLTHSTSSYRLKGETFPHCSDETGTSFGREIQLIQLNSFNQKKKKNFIYLLMLTNLILLYRIVNYFLLFLYFLTSIFCAVCGDRQHCYFRRPEIWWLYFPLLVKYCGLVHSLVLHVVCTHLCHLQIPQYARQLQRG